MGSSTFKNAQMKTGIEPDDCFYLQNCQIIVGISQVLERSPEILMSEARKEFRQWVRQNLAIDG